MAHRWNAPFDPAERKDFVRDWSEEMEKSQDTISEVSFTLPADAIAAGLQVVASEQQNGVLAVVWFVASDASALLAAFDGKDVAVSHSITTAAGRVLHETCMLRIKGK